MIFYFNKSLKKNEYNKDFIYLFIFSFFFIILWFIKFPVYRLGISQIYIFIILCFYLIYINHLNFIKLPLILKYSNFFIIFVIAIILSKNFNRIYNNRLNPLMPNVYYTDEQNKDIQKIYNNTNIFTHYRPLNGNLCGYSKSPCTHIDRNFLVKEFLGYKIYTIN